jgi:DNA-directed RNA polymerase subunit L
MPGKVKKTKKTAKPTKIVKEAKSGGVKKYDEILRDLETQWESLLAVG